MHTCTMHTSAKYAYHSYQCQIIIYKFNKKCIRVPCIPVPNMHTSAKYVTLFYKYQCHVTLFYKLVNGMVPALRQTFHYTNKKYKHSFFIRTTVEWNQLKDGTVRTNSAASFHL